MESASFWTDLRQRFIELATPGTELWAMELPGGGFQISGGPSDPADRAAMHSQFTALAARAALAADIVGPESPVDSWLRHLQQGPRHVPVEVFTDSDGTALVDLESGWTDALCLASAEACEMLATAAYTAEGRTRTTPSDARSPMARNIERLRLECGWAYEELSRQTGLDRKLVRLHLKHDKGARPATLKLYADAFSRALRRPVSVNDLLS